MTANQLISSVGASLLTTELFNLDSRLAKTADDANQIGINKKQFAQANEQSPSQKNCLLLLQNCDMLRKIAAKVGSKTINDPVYISDNLLEVKQQLSLQMRSILIGIAQKLGVLIPTLPNIVSSDLVTQNHLLVLGNGLILRAIASFLRIEIPAAAQLSGSIIEQNHQLLLANKKTLEAIARKLGATAAF